MECSECGFVQYANPKPTASALVVDDQGRVMFATRAHEPSAGKLDLPGGIADGVPTPDDDVLDFAFIDPDEIPWGDVAFPHIPDVISAWRGGQQDA